MTNRIPPQASPRHDLTSDRRAVSRLFFRTGPPLTGKRLIFRQRLCFLPIPDSRTVLPADFITVPFLAAAEENLFCRPEGVYMKRRPSLKPQKIGSHPQQNLCSVPILRTAVLQRSYRSDSVSSRRRHENARILYPPRTQGIVPANLCLRKEHPVISVPRTVVDPIPTVRHMDAVRQAIRIFLRQHGSRIYFYISRSSAVPYHLFFPLFPPSDA